MREKFLDTKTLLDFAICNYTTHYQKLQEEKLRIATLKAENETNSSSDNEENANFDIIDIVSLISKIIAILIIIIAIKLLFFRRKGKKQKVTVEVEEIKD